MAVWWRSEGRSVRVSRQSKHEAPSANHSRTTANWLPTATSRFICTMRFVILFANLSVCFGFAPVSPRLSTIAAPSSPTALSLSSQDGPSRSYFQGMQREPTKQELSIMDDMIDKLSQAQPYELPNAVSRAIRVVSSPQFFLRIAERADMASSDAEREKLSNFADTLVTTIQAVVEMTEDNLDERAKDVEKVVKAASEPDSGEFLVPLSKERVEDMTKAMEKLDIADLNEGFLSTVDAWMNKAHQVSAFTRMCV
jgi:hypothetical protein